MDKKHENRNMEEKGFIKELTSNMIKYCFLEITWNQDAKYDNPCQSQKNSGWTLPNMYNMFCSLVMEAENKNK